jgi:aryl-phospho-beta-D-glucosidase BglC (GH1 family)
MLQIHLKTFIFYHFLYLTFFALCINFYLSLNVLQVYIGETFNPPTMKRLTTIIIVVILFSFEFCKAQSFAFEQNRKIGRGVNIGNALEAPVEGEWGVTIEAKYFELIAEKGFHSVRVPIRWSSHSATASPYTIDASFFSRIDWVIENALKNKLMVIINCHHFNEIFENPPLYKNRLMSYWGQISRRYAHYSDSVIFEPLNEPNTNLSGELWNQCFSEALDTIRQTNPRRTVLVGLSDWGGIGGLSKLVLPGDTNLILTVHYYNPFQFTHQGAEWVSGSTAWIGTGWYNSEIERNAVASEFEPVIAFSKAHNIPVHIGEFGAYSKADIDSRGRWTNFCSRYFEEQGFSWTYWEFCYGFGIYNPVTSSWNQAILDALQTLTMPLPYVDPTGNLLLNGDFSYNITKWDFYTSGAAKGTFSVSDQKGVVNVSSVGSVDWSVQLVNTGINLIKGKKYILKFDAYSTPPRTVNIGVGQSGASYTTYFLKAVALTSSDSKFSYEFTMDFESDKNSRIFINLGANTGIYNIDNVSLREISSSTGIENVKTGNLLKIYPNPAQTHFNIECPGIQRVQIFNTNGAKVEDLKTNKRSFLDVNCGHLPNGIYVVKIQNINGEIINSPLAVSR